MQHKQEHRTKFSVIIPVYNRAKMVTEAIQSVLSQGFSDCELIVIDDGSTDDTPRRLEAYRDRVQIITQKNSGPEIARNRGAEAAKGEYLVFLDSDDLLMPWAMGVYDAIVSLMEHPALIVARMIYFNGERPVLPENADAEVKTVAYKDYLSKDRPVGKSFSAFVARKDVFQNVAALKHKRIGTFLFEDIDFLLRAGVQGSAVLIINPPTVAFRVHAEKISGETKRAVQAVLSMIRLEREGIYPGGRSRILDRYSFIGGEVFAFTKRAFYDGYPALGLELFLAGLPMVFAGAFRKLLIGLKGRKPTVKIKLQTCGSQQESMKAPS